VSRTALLGVLALFGAAREQCGTDTSTVGVNAPCERSSDCDKDLACVAGLCAPLPSAFDAGPAEGSRAPGTAADAMARPDAETAD
jgi:hypothetical protein